MNPAQQQFLQQWQGYLQQVSDQVTQITQEAGAGCQQLLQTHPDDPMPMVNALQALGIKVNELKMQVENGWTQQTERIVGMGGDSREVRDAGQQATEQLTRWIDEAWGHTEANWKNAAIKAMWPRVEQLMAQPVACNQCGAPITPRLRHMADSVQCSKCGAVNQTVPAPEVRTFYSMGPDIWAHATTVDQRLAADRQRRLAQGQAGAEGLLQWEKMERDYWTAFNAAKAQLLPASAEEQQKDVESKMKPILDELSYNDAWRQAKGMAPSVSAASASGPVPEGDDWGPLRQDQVEEFYYQSFRLDDSRNDPAAFEALLQRFGYRDNTHFEQVRQTFNRHLDPTDPALMQQQVAARLRAQADEQQDKLQSNGDLLAPVEGVTIEVYADIASQQSTLSPAELQQVLAGHQMDMAKFERVANGWADRMKQDHAVMTAFSTAFAAAQGRHAASGGGIDPSKYTFEQYCEIMGAQQAWSAQGKDVNAMLKQEFNLTAMDFSAISSHWGPKMATDMSLGARMGQLMTEASQKYMAR